MLGEVTHLQAIVDDLTVLTEDPHKLPPASEQVTGVIIVILLMLLKIIRFFFLDNNEVYLVLLQSKAADKSGDILCLLDVSLLQQMIK